MKFVIKYVKWKVSEIKANPLSVLKNIFNNILRNTCYYSVKSSW